MGRVTREQARKGVTGTAQLEPRFQMGDACGAPCVPLGVEGLGDEPRERVRPDERHARVPVVTDGTDVRGGYTVSVDTR